MHEKFTLPEHFPSQFKSLFIYRMTAAGITEMRLIKTIKIYVRNRSNLCRLLGDAKIRKSLCVLF